jgi:hypothetical protein
MMIQALPMGASLLIYRGRFVKNFVIVTRD